MLLLCLVLSSSSVSAAPIDQFSPVVPNSFIIGPSPLSPSFIPLLKIQSSSHQNGGPARRSFPSVYAKRRSAHSCRWKLCGSYHNYSSLRRFLNLENNSKK
ncbi:hypothetical protein niasHS_007510 [Heterodera schachtii]|uniref:Secreted protein n=1 Tax=Heterodera schachtii TaxID=97005 RepID=A0ABD2JXR4_HETSC